MENVEGAAFHVLDSSPRLSNPSCSSEHSLIIDLCEDHNAKSTFVNALVRLAVLIILRKCGHFRRQNWKNESLQNSMSLVSVDWPEITNFFYGVVRLEVW